MWKSHKHKGMNNDFKSKLHYPMYCPTYHVIYRWSPRWLWRKRLKSAVSTMRGITRNRDTCFQTQTKLPLLYYAKQVCSSTCVQWSHQRLCMRDSPCVVHVLLCCKHLFVSTCVSTPDAHLIGIVSMHIWMQIERTLILSALVFKHFCRLDNIVCVCCIATWPISVLKHGVHWSDRSITSGCVGSIRGTGGEGKPNAVDSNRPIPMLPTLLLHTLYCITCGSHSGLNVCPVLCGTQPSTSVQ